MIEHPIIYSTRMVKAYLEDRKTMTRRILTPQPDLGLEPFDSYSHIEVGYYHPALVDKDGELYPGDPIFGAYTDDGEWGWKCPYGPVGCLLWIRELYHFYARLGGLANIKYYADNDVTWQHIPKDAKTPKVGKHPSIHMPRWASRLTQTVSAIRIERLQDISISEALAEGIVHKPFEAISIFSKLWDSINAKRGYSWESNPWVWVISYPKYSEEPTRVMSLTRQ